MSPPCHSLPVCNVGITTRTSRWLPFSQFCSCPFPQVILVHTPATASFPLSFMFFQLQLSLLWCKSDPSNKEDCLASPNFSFAWDKLRLRPFLILSVASPKWNTQGRKPYRTLREPLLSPFPHSNKHPLSGLGLPTRQTTSLQLPLFFLSFPNKLPVSTPGVFPFLSTKHGYIPIPPPSFFWSVQIHSPSPLTAAFSSLCWCRYQSAWSPEKHLWHKNLGSYEQ